MNTLDLKSGKVTDVREAENIVVRFSGDSGDGMQLTGTQFTDTSAFLGQDISTFPVLVRANGFRRCGGVSPPKLYTPGFLPFPDRRFSHRLSI